MGIGLLLIAHACCVALFLSLVPPPPPSILHVHGTNQQVGFINSIQFNASGSLLTAAISQEPRLGRWERIRRAKNGCVIIELLGKPV